MATRLPAEERKAAVLDCACGIFSTGSYRGTTTAEIARRQESPSRSSTATSRRSATSISRCSKSPGAVCAIAVGAAVEAEPDPRLWVGAMGQAYFEAKDPKVRCADLWVQALTEASDDAEIRKFLRKQMREVHDYVSDVIRRSQEAGGIYPDREASAEAWIFISIGLLGTVGRRVGGLIDDDFPAIVTQRRRWMTGLEDTPDIPDTLDI